MDLLFCVDIGCDGCSVNLSVLCGAAKDFKNVWKNALICPYLNHALNLKHEICEVQYKY